MTDFDRIYTQWHEYAQTRNTEALINLYADDAQFESPLVPIIMQQDSGVLHGREAILAFLQEGTRRRPNELVRWYRTGRSWLCLGGWKKRGVVLSALIGSLKIKIV